MTQNNKKNVSSVIRIIGVQPTSFNLPKEVLRPRAPIEIKNEQSGDFTHCIGNFGWNSAADV